MGPTQIVKDVSHNIQLRLSTEGTVYKAGEKVLVTVYIQNLRSESIKVTPYRSCYPFNQSTLRYEADRPPYNEYNIVLYVVDLKHGYLHLYELFEEGIDMDTAASSCRKVTLEPGQDFTLVVVWDQRIKTKPYDIQAPSDEYFISGHIIGPYARGSIKKLTEVTVPIYIFGAETE